MMSHFPHNPKKIEMFLLLPAEYSDSNTHIQMNPRQAKEYKHSQKVKAEEMRHKRHQEQMKAEMAEAEKKQDGLSAEILDRIEETIEVEKARADYLYGKGAKGKMDVKVQLLEGKIIIKAVFVPAEGVRPIEGRADFGITRTTKW